MKVYDTQKVLDCITEIYELSKSPKAFSLSDVCRKYNLGSTIGKVMVQNGIIKIYKKGRPKYYLWNSIMPNVRMANSVIDRASKHGKEYRKELEERKNEKQTSLEDALNRLDKIKDCVQCKTPFVAKIKKHKFCSDRCRHKFHNDIFKNKKEMEHKDIVEPFSLENAISPFELEDQWNKTIQEKDEEIGLLNNQIKYLQSKIDAFESEKDLLKNNLEESEKMVKELRKMYEQEKNLKKTKGYVSNSTSGKEFNLLWGALKIKR